MTIGSDKLDINMVIRETHQFIEKSLKDQFDNFDGDPKSPEVSFGLNSSVSTILYTLAIKLNIPTYTIPTAECSFNGDTVYALFKNSEGQTVTIEDWVKKYVQN